MLKILLIACLLLIVTTAMHAFGMYLSLGALRLMKTGEWMVHSALTRITAVSVMVIIMFLFSVLEALAWAMTYVFIGALNNLSESLYFSIVTYTTLGYGDITLGDEWRLLASFEAANGTIMFGWTTALIVGVVHAIYQQNHPKEERLFE